MKIVNDTLKNTLKQSTTQRKGRILVNENYYDVYNVEYNADAYNDGNVIGNAIASQLDFELPYIERFNTFKYFDGVWTGSEYEYIDMGTFTVFDEKDEDDFNKHITAFDNLIKFNAPFIDVGGYPKTLFQELQNVCEQAGVVLNNTNIPNGSFKVANNQFVNEESLKTVLKAICQISGMYAIIKEDKLVLQLKNDTNEVLNKNQHEPVIWKRRTYGINQVVLGMKDVEGEYVLREDLQDIAKNGVHKLVINDNPFAYTEDKRAELIDELFNQVKGFGYVPFEVNGEWLSYLDVGDTITIDGVETLLLRINGKSPTALESVISAPAVIDSSVDYIDNTNSIENQMKRTEIIVDKQNQEIKALASKIIELSTTETGKGQVKFESATLGALGKISITGNIELFYPAVDEYGGMSVKSGIYKSGMVKASSYKTKSQSKYPSNDLFPRDTYLVIKQEDKEDVKYHLPIKRLNSTGSVSDEFIWEYNKMKIIHRVGIATNGDYYVLAQPYEEDLGELEITIPEGDGYFVFESFPFATISITYMLKNEYTETFSTKVEMKSEIKVATDEINLEVAKKVDSGEIISAINLSPEEIAINSKKIALEGYTTINGGFSVDENGNMTAKNGTFTGGEITLSSKDRDDVNAKSKLKVINDINSDDCMEMYPNYLQLLRNSGASGYFGSALYSSSEIGTLQSAGINLHAEDGSSINLTPFNMYFHNSGKRVKMLVSYNGGDKSVSLNSGNFSDMPVVSVYDTSNITYIQPNGIWTNGVQNNSLESKKKNIELDDGCLQEILDTNICSFNWKYEDDTDQKHIGCIIADEGGNYKVSSKVLTHDKDAIDLYSMSGMAWKAIQELYDIIKLQEQKIKELEERLDGVK